MRKISYPPVLIFIILILAGPLHSQDIYGGVKAGLNFAKFTGDDGEGCERNLGIVIGASAEKIVKDYFSVLFEALISAKGAKERVFIEGHEIEVKLRITYIDIIVMPKYYYPNKGKIRMFLNSGLYAGIKLSSDATIRVEESKLGGHIENLELHDFGLLIGVGIDLIKTNSKYTLDIRYSQGFSSVYDREARLDMKNSVISLMLGKSFDLDKLKEK